MKKVLIVVIVIVIVLVGAGVGAVIYGTHYVKGLDKAFDPEDTSYQILEIPSGSTTGDIGAILAEAGIIEDADDFKLYSRVNDLDGGYMAGTYGFSASMTMSEIAAILTEGRTSTVQFTIPEGYTVDEIAGKLSAEGVCSYEKFLEVAANDEFDYDFLADAPDGIHRLEGFLFPETYILPYGATPHEIIDAMLTQFDSMYTEEMRARTREMGYSLYEMVTIASIIEEECMLDDERPLVASVVYNRLYLDMPLGMDSTILFILGEHRMEITWEETEIDSPYNTYLYTGLPAGPISSPGIASIEAALYPADTDLLYFVVSDKGDGSMVYSNDYGEFLDAVEAYNKYMDELDND